MEYDVFHLTLNIFPESGFDKIEGSSIILPILEVADHQVMDDEAI